VSSEIKVIAKLNKKSFEIVVNREVIAGTGVVVEKGAETEQVLVITSEKCGFWTYHAAYIMNTPNVFVFM